MRLIRCGLIRSGMVALGLTLALPALSQTQPTSTDMQILADKVKADKKALVAANMQLTEAEAKSFWLIYDAYQKELDRINVRLERTLNEYADAYSKGPLHRTAKKLLDEMLAIQNAESKLQQTFVPKLERVLPEVKVARYIQLENKVRAVLRYSLASKIPLVE